MRVLVFYHFLVKLRVIFNTILGFINKNSKVVKIMLKKNLEFDTR